MAITITDTSMNSDLVEDTATRRPDGLWTTGGPTLGPARLFDRNQAITALILAEHLALWGSDHHCAHSDAWRAELIDAPYAPEGTPA